MSEEATRERKERVLHTRISEQLADDIRAIADDLRVPVSNLVRNVLEEAFDAVERVSGDVSTIVDDVIQEAELASQRYQRYRNRVRERARERRAAEAHATDVTAEPPASASDPLAGVVAWQPVVLAAPRRCARTGREPAPASAPISGSATTGRSASTWPRARSGSASRRSRDARARRRRRRARRQPARDGAALPGARLRPHVKAHKCTALARRQAALGHRGFTCATVARDRRHGRGRPRRRSAARERGARRAPARRARRARHRRGRLARRRSRPRPRGGVREVLIDVNVGLPRCGCAPERRRAPRRRSRAGAGSRCAA